MLSSSAFPADSILQTIKDETIGLSLKKGQKILYGREKAKVLSVRPVLVIKVKNRIICGDLYKDIHLVRKDKH